MSEYKPCPFCGSTKVAGFDDSLFIGALKVGFTVGVCCENCHAMVASTDKDKCINDMIKLWNRRVVGVEVRQYGDNALNITNCGTLNIK